MTEEDQLLVAKAALAGVRFYRAHNRFWRSSVHIEGDGNQYTIGRAAAVALEHLGLMNVRDHREYFNRTSNHEGPVDVDISTLVGAQHD